MADFFDEYVSKKAFDPNSNINQGIETGVKLAQEQEDLGQKKLQHEAMKMDLASKKTDAALGLINTYAKADPKFRKLMKDRMIDQSNQFGVPVINSFDAIDASPAYAQTLVERLSDPDFMTAVQKNPMKAIEFMQQGPYEQTQQNEAIKLLGKTQQFQQQKDLANIKADAAKSVAGGRVDLTRERLAQKEYDRFNMDPEIKKAVGSRNTLHRDYLTLQGAISSGKGITLQNLREVTNGVAAALAPGSGSALGDREAFEMSNLNTKLVELLNKGSTSGVKTVNDPKLFNQLMDTMTRVDSGYVNNIKTRAESKRRKSTYPGMEGIQADAIDKLTAMPGLNSVGGTPSSKPIPTAQQIANVLQHYSPEEMLSDYEAKGYGEADLLKIKALINKLPKQVRK